MFLFVPLNHFCICDDMGRVVLKAASIISLKLCNVSNIKSLKLNLNYSTLVFFCLFNFLVPV